MKKLLLLVLLLAGGVLGGKFYVESQYEKELDKAIEQASMFMDISYDKVSILLDGSVAIKDISIRPLAEVDELTIGSIEVYADDKSYLYKKNPFKDKMPGLMRWTVKSIEMDTSGYFYDNSIGKTPVCNFDEDTTTLANLGYGTFSGDLMFELRFAKKESAGLMVSAFVDGMSSIVIDATLDISDFAPASIMLGMKPKMSSVDFTYSQNETYSNAVITHCAKLKNITPEQYLDEISAAPEIIAEMGYEPGEGLQWAARQILSGKGELHLFAKPSEQVEDLSQLTFYKPADALKLLNLEIDIDGKKLDDLSFTKLASDSNSTTKQLDVLQEDVIIIPDNTSYSIGKSPAEVTITTTEQKAPGFTKIKQSSADLYVGYTVKVKRKSASDVQGKLLSVSGGKLKIQQRRYGGLVDFPVKKTDIRSMEVYL